MRGPIKPAVDNDVDPADHVDLARWACHKFTRRYRTVDGGRLDPEELYADAYLCLARCAELFDPSTGYAFSTYAARSMHLALLRATFEQRTGHRHSSGRRDSRPIPDRTHLSTLDLDHPAEDRFGHDDRELELFEARFDGATLLMELAEDERDTLLGWVCGERLVDIADRLGLSRARVGQIKDAAVKKVRRHAGLDGAGTKHALRNTAA